MSDDRFMRTRLLLGEEGVNRLQKASVMVVGLGAVGGYALEAIARAGVGKLILVDFDSFDITNINRQILALTSTIGRKKAEVAAARVKDINPACEVVIKDLFVNHETLPELLAEPADMVVDAIDSLSAKCDLIEELCRRQIPFISSMGAALKTDPACIRQAQLNQTKNCGLSRMLRSRLKKRGLDLKAVPCVYSDQQVNLPETAVIANPDDENGRPVRNTLGSLPTITAIFGLTIADYVIKSLSRCE